MASKAFIATLTALQLGGAAYAGTLSMPASASFDVPLALTKNADIHFGILKATTSGTYVVDPNGSLTASNGGVVIGGTHTAGQITIKGAATQTIAISTNGYTGDHGVIPSQATCNYNGSQIADCDAGIGGLAAPGGEGKVLKLGVKIEADGSQAAGTTAAPTFVVTVAYD